MASCARIANQLFRSLRDATRHRRLPVGGERFPLPDELIALDSEFGEALAKEARLKPKLIDSVLRQDHPAFCGIAAAMTVAQSEGKGPLDQKHFFDVFRDSNPWPPVMSHFGWDFLDNLPGSVKYPLLCHLQYDGVPMSLLGEWLKAQNFSIETVSAGEIDEKVFRSDIEAAFPPSADKGHEERRHLLVNYSRSTVGQRMFSGGHYAPIGGFQRASDKVLLLEVNSWRYPSVWVDLPLLWEATHTRVGNGKWRGYLRISSSPHTSR
eukprot:TRINITY_DN16287_c0_g3_i1.p1 TRINITY_DN16287_c0_g3~~TRINITY_DN16287_c0_g3_i1.p1  ORF type:complete len:277 (+),score=39.44 TRINITY_DN16287_c0_g3_i1:35-832(+)